MRLANRVALVTGASRGIGRATALAFASEGADLIINYNSNEKAALETFEKVKSMGRRAILAKANVGSKDEVEAMVNDALSGFGRVDILVNNAGIVVRDSIENLKEDNWEKVMAVNVKGTLNCIKPVVDSMIRNKYGRIINISSIAGLGTSTPGLTYSSSKSVVNILTKKLAVELGPYGITVNAIAPGFIMTDIVYVTRTPAEVEKAIKDFSQRAALRRIGQPEEIANVALFLASDESSFMTGQIVVVDGGRMDYLSHAL